MYLFILDFETKALLFSTYDKGPYAEIISPYIEKMIISNEKVIAIDDNYQFGIHIANDKIFISVQHFGIGGRGYDTIRSKKIENINVLSNFSREISDLLSLDEKNFNNINQPLSRIENELNHLKNNNLLNKIMNDYFHVDTEIRLIGNERSGVSSIFYLFLGLNYSSKYEDKIIPCNRVFNRKSIMLKKLNVPRGLQGHLEILLPNESNILYVIDSTNKKLIRKDPYYHKLLEEAETKQNILIIANKQDLPNAMSSEEVEKIMGYPTAGFSAIAPDAPEKLEKIILDFLNNKYSI